jgi:hypothetical protein
LCLVGIDLDALNERLDGESDEASMFRRKQRARKVVAVAREHGAYVEASPSRGGIHIIGRAYPLVKGIHRDHVEIYTRGRYFTLTTRGASGGLADIGGLVADLIAEIAPGGAKTAAGGPAWTTDRTGKRKWDDLTPNIQSTVDSWLTTKADGTPQDREARKKLWEGDLAAHGGDHSAADLSLVSQLVRRGLADDEVDLAMRASGLYRPKWDERRGSTTYGGLTVAKALESASQGGQSGGGSPGSGAAPGGNGSAGHGAGTPAGAAARRVMGIALSTLPPIIPEAQAPGLLNCLIFKAASFGAGPAFGRFDSDGSVNHLRPEDLSVLLSGHFVETPAGQGAPRLVPADVWWKRSGSKTVYDRVLYDPEGKRALPGERILNTWRGFAVTPAQGSWRKMRWHIWALLCGRNRPAFKYLFRWLAHAVQHPGSNPEVMVVLRSDNEGVGKSSLGQWILRMFGPHGHEATSYRQVFGEFSDALIDRSFILLEEAIFPGDHKAAETLRALITANRLHINPKGRTPYDVPNFLHIVMTTNGEWAVPAGADARRFLVLNVTEKRPRSYFDELWAEAENGGIAAMLHDLLRIDLCGFNPRDVPATVALMEQQRRSADDITQWITDAVLNGTLFPYGRGGACGTTDGFGTICTTTDLFTAYRNWALVQGYRRLRTAREFGRALGAMGLTRSAGNNPPKWLIPDAATLQRAADRRAGIRTPVR